MRSLRVQTWALGAIGLAAVAVVGISMRLVSDDSMSAAISSVGGLAIAICALVAMVFSVRSMDSGPIRDRWLLITMGVAMFAIGDLVWAYIEVVQGLEPPYPGLPDLFYVGEYALLGTALLAAGLSYRGLVDYKRPALMAATISAVCAAALWWSFIGELALDAQTPAWERVFNVFYPMADVTLLIGAALFTVFMIAQLGGGRLAWPWWSVAVGTVILSITDTMFSWTMATGSYASGALVDIGWLLAHVAIAFGAVVAQDVAVPLRGPELTAEAHAQSV